MQKALVGNIPFVHLLHTSYNTLDKSWDHLGILLFDCQNWMKFEKSRLFILQIKKIINAGNSKLTVGFF